LSKIEYLTRRQKWPVPKVRGLEGRIIFVLIGFLTAGILFSINLSNWENIQRAGSAIVVLGIAVTWLDLMGQIDHFATITDARFRESYEKATAGITQGTGLLRMPAAFDVEKRLVEVRAEVAPLFKALKVRMRALEAIVLVLGTTISGFGGLLEYVWPLQN
jgi:hypothetical protein